MKLDAHLQHTANGQFSSLKQPISPSWVMKFSTFVYDSACYTTKSTTYVIHVYLLYTVHTIFNIILLL